MFSTTIPKAKTKTKNQNIKMNKQNENEIIYKSSLELNQQNSIQSIENYQTEKKRQEY